MIKIKVVKASQLALCAAVILFIIALIIFGGRLMSSGNADVGTREGAAVAASSAVVLGATFENEHTDEESSLFAAELERDMPSVLIYHTHTHEAYEQVAGDEYAETSAWRTVETSHSVVRVGDELKRLLEMYGFSVTHDATDNEGANFNSAYSASLDSILAHGKKFDIYIDLHRDAYQGGERAAFVNDQWAARIMLLIGTGENFADKPDYEENYAFAAEVTGLLNAAHPGICRDVMVKKNRYNQHVGTPALLIEVGHNKNTLQEALASMPYLADAIAGAYLGVNA